MKTKIWYCVGVHNFNRKVNTYESDSDRLLGSISEKNEATSCYLFEHDGFRLLVDCGSGALAQLQNVIDIEQIDAVIVSHYHHDHVADIGPLQYARLIKKNLGGALPELAIYGHSLDRDGFARLAHKGVTKAVAYDPNETLHIGPFTISFMETEHPAFVMRCESRQGKKRSCTQLIQVICRSSFLFPTRRIYSFANAIFTRGNMRNKLDI
ncbi:Ribonuclease BN [Anoxybacillus sp. BCO1]|nr:Ribonuclease BN [Anoxybacillus sp. BCO1]